MNISLTPELEKIVYEKVNSGLYTSASEVIRESLRLMNSHSNSVRQLNYAIDFGLQQLSAGDKVTAQKSYSNLRAKIERIARDKK